MKSITSYLFLILMIFCTNSWSSQDNIWVQKEKHHTALIVPVTLVLETTPELESVVGDSPYIRFGWGDKKYYGASNKSISKALKALFLPTKSVIEVSQLSAVPSVDTKVISLNNSEILNLMRFISGSFNLSPNNKPQIVRKEENGFRYFKAHGKYHFFKNCNNWTAKALKKAGTDIWYQLAYFSNWVMKWSD